MANNELLIANLGALGAANLQVYIESADKNKTSTITVGPQSFVQINASQVGTLPWNLGINNQYPQPTVTQLPAVVNVVLNTLTAILYPSTAPK